MSSAALKKLESQLAKLKMEISKTKKTTESKPKKSSKPKRIEDCAKKSDLAKFTIAELKDWIKSNGIKTKKLYEKHKADLVKLVWKKIKSCSDSGCSESDSSDSYDSDSETDSESDSDSD
jgi:hypothetical protein